MPLCRLGIMIFYLSKLDERNEIKISAFRWIQGGVWEGFMIWKDHMMAKIISMPKCE